MWKTQEYRDGGYVWREMLHADFATAKAYLEGEGYVYSTFDPATSWDTERVVYEIPGDDLCWAEIREV